jgi:hypothetical protein
MEFFALRGFPLHHGSAVAVVTDLILINDTSAPSNTAKHQMKYLPVKCSIHRLDTPPHVQVFLAASGCCKFFLKARRDAF